MSNSETDTTRERIADAAGEVFAERGFDAATIREICKRADANIAAVNYYFGDKECLYLETVVRAHQWRMKQFPLPDWNKATPPETKLADFIKTLIRRVRSGLGETWHTRLLMREFSNQRVAGGVAERLIEPQFEILQGILREMLPADLSEEELHLTAFSIVGQCLFYFFGDAVVFNLVGESEYAGFNIDKLANHIVAFSLSALGTRNTSLRKRAAR